MEKQTGIDEINTSISDLVDIIRQYIVDQIANQDQVNKWIKEYLRNHIEIDKGLTESQVNELIKAYMAEHAMLNVDDIPLVNADQKGLLSAEDYVSFDSKVKYGDVPARIVFNPEEINQIPSIDDAIGAYLKEYDISSNDIIINILDRLARLEKENVSDPGDGGSEPIVSPSELNMKEYGCVGDGSADETSKINAALATNSTSFYFPGGTYRISSTITVPEGKKLYGDGKDVSQIISSTTGTLFMITGENEFMDIGLESTYDMSSMHGIITADNAGSNSSMTNCKFSAAACDGIKIIGEYAEVKEILIEKCDFINIGGTGVRLQNKVSENPNPDGYHHIKISECYFYNTGMTEDGIGISFSGYGSNNTVVNSTFKKMGKCGIEFAGCCNSLIQNNIFDDAESRFRFFECAEERMMHDNQIINNKKTSTEGSSLNYLRSSQKTIFSGNDVGFIEMRDMTDSTFDNNTYTPYGPYAIYVEGVSTGNIFSDSVIDLSKAPTSRFYSMIRISGMNAVGNTFSDLMTTVKPGGVYVSAINDGDLAKNTFSNIKTNTGVVIYK